MKLLTMSCAAMAVAENAEAEMSFADKIGEGLITLVLGMGTVFAVLIFLWVIIALVGKAIGAGKKPKAAPAPAPVAAPEPVAAPAPAVETDLGDAELVAVMTAAIAAFGGESSSRIRIRSVRRTTNWNK